jgi:YfiH family protein
MSIAVVQADWQAPPGVIAGTTLRSGGHSEGPYASLNLGAHVGDEPAAVAANRASMLRELGLPAEPLWLRQTHGTEVAIESPADTAADARVTWQRGRVCAVLTADCLPVVLAAIDGSEVAVAHAGWRGLCNGILENTVRAMRTDATALQAWLGPAISQPAFEVGDEVREAFLAVDPAAAAHFSGNERSRYQADLYGLARQRLASLGVSPVSGGQCCTHAEAERFYSYRRDGACGRMATFAYMA